MMMMKAARIVKVNEPLRVQEPKPKGSQILVKVLILKRSLC
jgi:hypothetical protein